MQEIMGQVKSITNNHTKGQSSCKEGDVCIWWDWKGVLYYEFFWKTKRLIPASAASSWASLVAQGW